MNLGELRKLVAAVPHWPDACQVTVSGEPVATGAVEIHYTRETGLVNLPARCLDWPDMSVHHEPITFVVDLDGPDYGDLRGGRL